MFNVVVRTASTAKELIQNNSVPFRVTYIPLDKVNNQPMISDEMVRNLKNLTGNRVFLAKELLEYAPDLEPAMNQIFSSTMVALDEDTAKKIAFNNNYGKFNCVTLKGDKYNP
jgi:structural maintenance of chromosome 2